MYYPVWVKGRMAYCLFIDESGHDRKASPYEVLAGVAILDSELWPLVQEIHALETLCFGRRYSAGTGELKGTKILKAKVFQHAELNASVGNAERAALAKSALDDGASAGIRELKALGLAKLDYVARLFEICERRKCRAFASIVETDATPTSKDVLRKDYAYLFERFFYFLEDNGGREQGVVVFDELDKTRSHLLIDQMQRYFREFATGRQRAGLVVPEPFFVHSDLTTGVQIADLIAYVISWGYRVGRIDKPARRELGPFAKQVERLRYDAERPDADGIPRKTYGFTRIDDLRGREEKENARL